MYKLGDDKVRTYQSIFLKWKKYQKLFSGEHTSVLNKDTIMKFFVFLNNKESDDD